MKVISHTGKATGQNKIILNVCVEGENLFWFDFRENVIKWKNFVIYKKNRKSAGRLLQKPPS